MRLDQYLAQLYPSVSRHYLKELIKKGLVLVNSRSAKPSYQVKGTDQVQATVPPKESPHLTPEKFDLPIIYEDDDILVIDKPSGLVVHPAAGHPSGTLVNALLGYLGEGVASVGERTRPGLVHRLDKETSGLLVVAKKEAARLALVRAFSGRTVHKEYLALIAGRPPEPAGEIDLPIGRDPRNRLRFAGVSSGKEALTRYFTEKEYRDYTLMRLAPVTGRTHQLRVHLASLGRPIVGDTVYGGEPAPRLFLHAAKLSFRLNGVDREFSSPLPKELTKYLAKLDVRA
jgi:23S rRNA pseudouridine1911/1915/1917 synthase